MDGGLRRDDDGEEGAGQEPPEDRRGVLIGLLVVIALVLGGLYLFNTLRDSSRLQDCEMQGRTNCAPIDVSAHGAPN